MPDATPRPQPSPTPAYLRPYAEATADLGAGFDALLWRNRDFQIRRFDLLAELAPPEGRVVADLGAGLADLGARLADLGRHPAGYVAVEGIDDLAAQAQAACEALPFPAAALRADFAADRGLFQTLVERRGCRVLVFSGSLNTFAEPRALRVLDRAWRALSAAPGAGRFEGAPGARTAASGASPPPPVLAFNFLSAAPSGRSTREVAGPAKRFETARVVRWALERTPLIRVATDHLAGHDATVAMYVPVAGDG